MTKAIFFEFTFVCSIWFLIALAGDRIAAVRRHISAQRAIARRLQYSASRIVITMNATANPHTNISTRIPNPLGV
jgi:hypothetical protein